MGRLVTAAATVFLDTVTDAMAAIAAMGEVITVTAATGVIVIVATVDVATTVAMAVIAMVARVVPRFRRVTPSQPHQRKKAPHRSSFKTDRLLTVRLT